MRRSGETIEDVSSVVAGPPPQPTVVLVAAGTEVVHKAFVLGDGPLLVGRVGAVGDGVELDDDRVSRQHASIERRARQWIVRDLGSRNGTFSTASDRSPSSQASGDRVVRVGHSVLLLLDDGRGHDEPPVDEDDAVVGPELARSMPECASRRGAHPARSTARAARGKELAARLYHDAAPRASGPFVAVNCAAIPEGVAERLLFGAKKGAFSGATGRATATSQAADGGTLFLDEIARSRRRVQAKLLRVLETREVIAVGASARSASTSLRRGDAIAICARGRGERVPRRPLLPARAGRGACCRRCARAAPTSRAWSRASSPRSIARSRRTRS